MDGDSYVVQVKMPDQNVIHVEARILGGEEDIAAREFSFDRVTATIESVANALTGTLTKFKPDKASVEFGLELAAESGTLTALLVKGSGTATLTVTLEWGKGK